MGGYYYFACDVNIGKLLFRISQHHPFIWFNHLSYTTLHVGLQDFMPRTSHPYKNGWKKKKRDFLYLIHCHGTGGDLFSNNKKLIIKSAKKIASETKRWLPSASTFSILFIPFSQLIHACSIISNRWTHLLPKESCIKFIIQTGLQEQCTQNIFMF